MPEVLAPRLELLGRPAHGLPKPNEGVSETVWVEVGQAGAGKGIPEDRANSRSAAPMCPFQTDRFKLSRVAQCDICRREERIVICLLYTSPSPRDRTRSRMPSSA